MTMAIRVLISFFVGSERLVVLNRKDMVYCFNPGVDNRYCVLSSTAIGAHIFFT